VALILAFGSAAVFALGTVLQQRVVMDAPEAKDAGAGILFRLIQHPVWLGGIAAYGIAFSIASRVRVRNRLPARFRKSGRSTSQRIAAGALARARSVRLLIPSYSGVR
jgi:hypothetical protein